MTLSTILNGFSMPPTTRRLYRRGVELFEQIVKDVPVSEITEAHFSMFCKYLVKQKHLKQSTRYAYTKGVIKLLKSLSNERLCDVRVTALSGIARDHFLKIVKRKYYLPERIGEFAEKYHEVPPPPQEPHKEYLRWLKERAFIAVLEASGSRITAATEIRVRAINWRNPDIVRIKIVAKGDKDFTLRLSRIQGQYVRQWLNERGVAHDFVFNSEHKKNERRPITAETGRQIVYRWARLILGDDVEIKPHDLRHLFITIKHDRLGLKAAQKLAGHSTSVTTEKYIPEVEEEELDDLFRKAQKSE